MVMDEDDDEDMMIVGGGAGVMTTNSSGGDNHENSNMNVNDSNDMYEEIREQDRYLPIANIARIMKNTLPENAKIAKESKETVQECVSEFISFITSEASDKCLQEKRKTINGDDLLFAMSTLGFDKYVEPLKEYLRKYRDTVKKPPKGGSGE
jgi:nuclear transcription Y subunit beta